MLCWRIASALRGCAVGCPSRPKDKAEAKKAGGATREKFFGSFFKKEWLAFALLQVR
jgi:hypothetical protein